MIKSLYAHNKSILTKSNLFRTNKFFSTNESKEIGFIGLGSMGSKMVENFRASGYSLKIYDVNANAMKNLSHGSIVSSSIKEIAESCSVVFSILPNDEILTDVSEKLMQYKTESNNFTHVSCSTVSPATSRSLAERFTKLNCQYVSAPVFARPDGIAKKQSFWMVSGPESGRAIATDLLSLTGGKVFDFGDDNGAANVVKLCGNFLIAVISYIDIINIFDNCLKFDSLKFLLNKLSQV